MEELAQGPELFVVDLPLTLLSQSPLTFLTPWTFLFFRSFWFFRFLLKMFVVSIRQHALGNDDLVLERNRSVLVNIKGGPFPRGRI